MKKLLTLILCVVMVFGSFGSFASAQELNESPAQILYSEEFEADFAQAKGLIDMLVGKEIFSTGVSRGEFIKALFEVLKINTVEIEEAFFSDVKSKDEFAPYVYTAVELGWISKGSLFEPGRIININEAVKVLCCAMNYQLVADNKGGYPAGYFYVANKLDLLNNLEMSSEELDVKNGYVLLLNALIAPTLEQIAFGDSEDYTTSGSSLLYTVYDVYVAEGVVSRTFYNTLAGAEFDGMGNVVEIEGVSYNGSESCACAEFIGRKCRAYIAKNTVGKDTVLYMADISAKLELDIMDINDVKSGSLEYWLNDGSRKKTAKLSEGCAYILNGRVITAGISDAFKPGAGRVVLADNNNDNVYDVAYVERYSYIMVKSYDPVSETIRDTYHSDFTLNVSEAVCIVKNLDGENVDILDIAPGNIYRVIKSADGGYMSLVQIEGEEFTDYYNGSEGTYLSIGTEYYLMSDYLNITGKQLKSGCRYSFVTDGDVIISASENIGNGIYGYAIGAEWQSGMESELQVKIFNQNGKFHIYNVREKVTVDGEDGRKDTDVFAVLNRNPQLVRYTINSKSEIDMIDFASTDIPSELGRYDDLSNCLTKYEALSKLNLSYFSVSKTMGMRYSVAGSIIFSVPADLNNEDGFEIVGANNLTNNSSYEFEVYNLDVSGQAEVLVTTKTHFAEHCDNASMIIKSVTRAIDENGNETYKIYGFKGNSFTTVYLPKDTDVVVSKNTATGTVVNSVHETLSSGDMINYAVNSEGEIKALRVLFDARKGAFVTSSGGVSNPEGANNWSVFNGMIYDVNGTIVSYSVVKDSEGAYDFSPENLRFVSVNTSNMCQYDCESTQIRNADVSTIKTYKSDGNDAHYIAVQANYFNPKMVVFYENAEVR